MTKFSLIIVSFNNLKLLKNCLNSVYNAACKSSVEIIVVDNNSEEEVINYLEEQPGIILIKNNFNAGFGKANNMGAKLASGEWLVLLNNDTTVPEDFFLKADDFLKSKPGCDIMGPLVLSPDGFPQSTFYNRDYYRKLVIPDRKFRDFVFTLSFGTEAGKKRQILYKNSASYSFVSTHQAESLSGVCMFINKKVTDTIGLFDENYFMYVEDLDFCLRAVRHGFRLWFYPEIEIYHFIKPIKNKPTVSWFRYNDHLRYFFRKNFPFYINLFAQPLLLAKALLKSILIRIRS